MVLAYVMYQKRYQTALYGMQGTFKFSLWFTCSVAGCKCLKENRTLKKRKNKQ